MMTNQTRRELSRTQELPVVDFEETTATEETYTPPNACGYSTLRRTVEMTAITD